jgi:hypothetical protein
LENRREAETRLVRREKSFVLAVFVLLWPIVLDGAPIPVHFAEGSLHAFLALRTTDATLIASGDIIQTNRGRAVESQTIFQFKDGSLFDETVVFSQQRVFKLERYRLTYNGPSFDSNTDISIDRTSKRYHVKSKKHKGGKEEFLEGSLDLPLDAYLGCMILIVVKNLSKGTSETVHTVAFTPTPRLIQLTLEPAGQDRILVGELKKNTTHLQLKPELGVWLKIISSLAGRTPPDSHSWITFDRLPAFVRFEGPLYVAGPIWRIGRTKNDPRRDDPGRQIECLPVKPQKDI